MFKWVDKSCVESDEGFALQFIGRFSFEYRAGETIVSGECENGAVGSDGVRNILVNSATIKFDSGDPIRETDKARIIKNISDAMSFQNLRLVLDPPALDVRQLSELSPKIKFED